MAVGVGFQVVSRQVTNDAVQPLQALGVLAIALGVGFVLSALISFVISKRLGLIEPAPRTEQPGV
jgi:predicted acyltransferase